MTKEAKKEKRGISIRWKLAVYFGVFVAIILFVSWIFQIYFLDTFYEQAKKRELESSAAELSLYLESDKLPVLAHSHALNGTMSVNIYRINGTDAEAIVRVDATGQTDLEIPKQRLSDYYNLAVDHGGEHLFKRGFGDWEGEHTPFFPFADPYPKHARMIYTGLATGESGAQYLIVLHAGLQPLDSMVETFRIQFAWMVVVLIVCAGVMVFLLYRHISAPLVHMNESAKLLAKGKYDTEFSGDGYLETRELADTLNYAARELSSVDELQKELIANVSHDLRTPLTMIKGYSEVMRDIPDENTPENVQIIIDETTRLSELVDDLMDLSKLRSGSLHEVREVFDMTEALRETLTRYDALIHHRGYHIVAELCEASYVNADRGMILQVLYNLINNAVNYTGEDRSVTVTETVANGRVRISIADTGEGIAPDQMPHIWERYYKIDKHHRRSTIGTGLGLSIVKEILEKHNAAYGVTSKLGEGSVFWFELPTVEP